VTFAEGGVGVVSTRGERPRCSPGHRVVPCVEPWSGGVIPEWWVDPELNRRARPPCRQLGHRLGRHQSHPRRPESGALIGIQTPTQTYRFLIPGATCGRSPAWSRPSPSATRARTGPPRHPGRPVGSGRRAAQRATAPTAAHTCPTSSRFLVVGPDHLPCAAVTVILVAECRRHPPPYLVARIRCHRGRLREGPICSE